MNVTQNPSPFYWGTATSSFQIEGSPLADGAAPSDWYRLTHLGDKVVGGDTADTACDHYHRWKEDLDLMKELEVNAYRFSIAWPRIFSDKHRINARGLDFYDRLIDGLCERNIEPFITLFHWDMPEWMDREYGWLSPEAVRHFGEYAEVIFERFGDRVSKWVTFNEPIIYYHSYVTGWHWPFRKDAYGDLLRCWNNILLSHDRAVQILKSRGGSSQIGLVHSYHLLEAASDSKADQEALARADGFRNRWFLDRLCLGRYPDDILEMFGDIVPDECRKPIEDFSPPDFLGVNYYAIGTIQNDPSVAVLGFSEPQCEFELQPLIRSQPEGLSEMIRRVYARYQPREIYITENGYLEHEADLVNRDPLQDVTRQKFLRDHLAQIALCRAEGFPLKGYFHWSLLDNFEWRWGMSRRFGLVHVDRKDQTRRVKKSGWLYRELIRESRDTERSCDSQTSCKS